MIKKRNFQVNLLILIVGVFSACRQPSDTSYTSEKPINPDPKQEKQATEAHFTPFEPDSVPAIKIKGFHSDYTYKVGENYIVVGYYRPVDGQIVPPDTEDNWGDRLLFLDAKKNILFTSKGVGDVYLYQPHFYKSNDRIIVICQLAYEYFFGGDAYLIENNAIQSIGNIDIETIREDKTLIDILRIKAVDSTIVFSFDADSLLLKPGSEDIPVKNTNIRYELDDQSLKLMTEDN